MGCVCEKERSKLVFGLRTAAAGESRVAMLFVSPGLTCLQQFLWPGGLRGWLASAVESPTSRREVANKVFSYNGDTAVGTQPATANAEGDGDEEEAEEEGGDVTTATAAATTVNGGDGSHYVPAAIQPPAQPSAQGGGGGLGGAGVMPTSMASTRPSGLNGSADPVDRAGLNPHALEVLNWDLGRENYLLDVLHYMQQRQQMLSTEVGACTVLREWAAAAHAQDVHRPVEVRASTPKQQEEQASTCNTAEEEEAPQMAFTIVRMRRYTFGSQVHQLAFWDEGAATSGAETTVAGIDPYLRMAVPAVCPQLWLA